MYRLNDDYSHLDAARRQLNRKPTAARSAWRVLRVAVPIIAACYLVLGVAIWAVTR